MEWGGDTALEIEWVDLELECTQHPIMRDLSIASEQVSYILCANRKLSRIESILVFTLSVLAFEAELGSCELSQRSAAETTQCHCASRRGSPCGWPASMQFP